MRKINFRKSQGTYQISFENCTLMERSSRNFQSSSSYRKVQTSFAFPNRYLPRVTESYYRSNPLSFIGSNDSCKDRELKISLNSLYVPTRTEIFCSFTFTDNSFPCTVNYSHDGHQSVVDPGEGPHWPALHLGLSRLWQ